MEEEVLPVLTAGLMMCGQDTVRNYPRDSYGARQLIHSQGKAPVSSEDGEGVREAGADSFQGSGVQSRTAPRGAFTGALDTGSREKETEASGGL